MFLFTCCYTHFLLYIYIYILILVNIIVFISKYGLISPVQYIDFQTLYNINIIHIILRGSIMFIRRKRGFLPYLEVWRNSLNDTAKI